jgi:hypothetical protein
VNPAQQRCWQTLGVVEKEAFHLRDVAGRLFDAPELTADWLRRLLEDPAGRDRMEAFVGKFSRLQDTLIDKLLPQFLAAVGEKTGTALDNLHRAERLQLLADPDQWLSMRQLRNRLVHEYVADLAELAAALRAARPLVDALLLAAQAFRRAAENQFPPLQRDGSTAG